MQKKKNFQWTSEESQELAEAFLKLKKVEDVKSFLRDICTISELQAMTERYQVAQLLKQGVAYRKIAEKTGVSTTTVTRVAHWMKHGEGGYGKALV